MSTIGRGLFRARLAVTLLLLVWAWVGRGFFGALGVVVAVLPMVAGPFVVLGLIVLEVLNRKVSRQHFTTAQSAAYVAMWVGLFGVGVFIVDSGKTPDSEVSIWTQLVGHSPATIDTSYSMLAVSAAVVIIGWLAAVAAAIIARRRAREPGQGRRPAVRRRPAAR